MAFDYINAILMTRSISTFLTNTVDADIQTALDTFALPHIRFVLMTATDGTNMHSLFDHLTDLADPSLALNTETLLDDLMEEPTIKNSIRRMAAQLAAANLLLNTLSPLDSQQKFVAAMIKQADSDLDRLVKSPLLKTAAAAVALASRSAKVVNGVSVLYIAMDGNPLTQNLTTNTIQSYQGAQLPFPGAPEAGHLGVTINGVNIQVTVLKGDTPIMALQRLVNAFELYPPTSRPNVNLAINELQNVDGPIYESYIDPTTGLSTTQKFNISHNPGAQMTLMPRLYDATMQYMMATAYLESRDPNNPTAFIPGVRGFRYGTTNQIIDMTIQGPHSVAAALSQGKSVAVATAGSSKSAFPISDSFFFQCTDISGLTTVLGNLTYQVNAHPIRSIVVPVGTSPEGLASLMAQDLAAGVDDQHILGAVRPSSVITVSGSPLSAPSLEMVAFALETELTSIVIAIKTVPQGVSYGVVNYTSLTSSLFDSSEKSIVVKTIFNKPRVQGANTNAALTGTEGLGGVAMAVHVQSSALQRMLANFGMSR